MSTQEATKKRNPLLKMILAGFGHKQRGTTERDKFFKRKDELSALYEEEEREAQAEARRRQALEIKQAKYYAGLLPRALQTQEQYHVEHKFQDKGKDKRVVRRVRILRPYLIHQDYYMFQVDMQRLPEGVNPKTLTEPATIKALAFALQTEVGFDDSDVERGFWYLVAKKGGVGIVPRIVTYEEALKLIPKSASTWTIPIGCGMNKRITHLDIRKKPHFLIAGTTGAGKSVFLKNMILTLCANNSPARLRIIIADFKNGPDMLQMRDLPHLGTPSKVRTVKRELVGIDDAGELVEESIDDFAKNIISEPEDILPILDWASRETNRRNALFAQQRDVTNINEYNNRFRRKPLPRILIVLDELPVAMLEVGKTQAKAMEQKLSAITRKGRSAGISIVIGSQVGTANVISGAIGQNISCRVVGWCTGTQSQVVLGNWFAHEILNRPGRVAYVDDLEQKELQTPFVSPSLATGLVKAIVDKWSDGHDEDDTALRLFNFCLERADGVYDPETLYKYFPDDDDITRELCREIGNEYELRELDDGTLGPIINLLDTDFYLLPGINSIRPRKLVTVEDYRLSQTTADPEPEPEPEPIEAIIYGWELRCLQWAITENAGKLGWRDCYGQFKDAGLTANMAKSLYRDQIEFELDGLKYQIMQGTGPLPRRAAVVGCEMRDECRAPDADNSNDTPQGEENSPQKIDDEFLDELPSPGDEEWQ